MLIDTHAHTNDIFFKDDLGQIISLAVQKGVEKIICASTSLNDSLLSIKAAKEYPENIFPAVGLYPHRDETDLGESDEDSIKKLEDIIKQNRSIVVGVGECGLDVGEVVDGEKPRSLDAQKKVLLAQIELALKYDLPILVHCRKAHEDLLQVLNSDERFKSLKGIFHCYVGGKKRLKDFMVFDRFMFGVAGLITYDEGLQQVVAEIPLDRIVLETDSPFLAPIPYRGERGLPSYIPIIANKVAELKDTSFEEVARQTSENVAKIFGI